MSQLQYEDQDLVVTLRENHRLLRELSLRFGVDHGGDSGVDGSPAVIHSPKDAYELLAPEMESLAQEQLRLLLLNTKNAVVGQRVIYQGNANSTMCRPAEIFRPAVISGAVSILIAHDHPSGDPTPSPEDIKVTKDIRKAGKLLGIELLDHIVIGRSGFRSIAETWKK